MYEYGWEKEQKAQHTVVIEQNIYILYKTLYSVVIRKQVILAVCILTHICGLRLQNFAYLKL